MSAVRKPRTTSIEAAVNQMTFEQLECRDFGHSWKPYTARILGGRLGGYEFTLICDRCETKRYRQIGRTGALVKSKYDYEPGYLIHGLGQLTRDDRDEFRLATVVAVIKRAQ